jgi:hypothetical protein
MKSRLSTFWTSLLVSNSVLCISGCTSWGFFMVVSMSSSNFFNSFYSMILWTFVADVPLREWEYFENEKTSHIHFFPHEPIHSACSLHPVSQVNNLLQLSHLYLNSSIFIYAMLFSCWTWVTSIHSPSPFLLIIP